MICTHYPPDPFLQKNFNLSSCKLLRPTAETDPPGRIDLLQDLLWMIFNVENLSKFKPEKYYERGGKRKSYFLVNRASCKRSTSCLSSKDLKAGGE